MPSFTIRVKLHGAGYDSEAYDALHEAMEARNFSRSITLDAVTDELAPAQYSQSGDSLTARQVLRDAQTAANDVWKDFSITVTQADKPWLQWSLKKIK